MAIIPGSLGRELVDGPWDCDQLPEEMGCLGSDPFGAVRNWHRPRLIHPVVLGIFDEGIAHSRRAS